ncbi:MAG: 3-oxoacyl-ACP reductase [Myxococcales bacterium]|nr:3-oxoacyl-ACP reductase [Myxococcales bacterium]
MTDLLVDLGRNATARRLIGALGLPLPLPTALRRGRGPMPALCLADQSVVVGAAGAGGLVPMLAETLAAAGARPLLAGWSMDAFVGPGEAYGRPPRAAESLAEGQRVDALVFDASGLDGSDALAALHGFFQPWVGRVARSGRVLLLGRPADDPALTSGAAAAQSSLDGFVKSLAKELGRHGVTANLLRVEPGAEGRAGAVVRWLLTNRSAFVSGQALRVSLAAAGEASAAVVRPLEKRVALVTGAAQGIGAATARALAAEGAHVLCLDRPQEEAAATALARELGGTAVAADLSDPASIAAVVAAVAALGGVDVVVHNAGVTRDRTMARMKREHWDAVLAVNLRAVLALDAALDPLLREGGRVVCLSSIAGIAGNVGQTAYAASKAALIGWVRARARELGARGVAVNAVAPGFIETRMTAAVPVAIREAGRRLSALGQGGLPEDVAATITFLAGPAGLGVTGQTLRVCGGAFLGA